MPKRNYVTSMGAWYGFKPWANFKELGIDRIDFVKWMKKRGFQIDIPKSDLISNYQLFTNKDFKIGYFENTIENSEFTQAKKYHERIVSLPTFTFEEYKIIDKYIDYIKEYGEKNNVRNNKR